MQASATDPDAAGFLQLPLFPLSTVLLPGSVLALQIFETRYLDMVGRCMREGAPFGVVLILEGREARSSNDQAPPRTAEIGTMARIVDFTQLPSGMLGITAHGSQRFRVHESRWQPDHLLVGEVERLPASTPLAVPEEYGVLVDILHQLVDHPAVNRMGVEVDWEDAGSVSCRLADLLPIPVQAKQALLELDDPLLRLAEIERMVHAMQQSSSAPR